jgi:general secretion pathway protein A
MKNSNECITMYHQYFGFNKSPFSIAPDPHNVYMSLQHREALAHLLFGVTAGGGFVLLTGEIGTGKTTMCRCLLEQLPPTCDVAFIFNPKLTALDLLLTICDELHIELGAAVKSTKTLVDRINTHLLNAHASGRNTLLIIDEAQNLSADVLEQMRLLTNLETNECKLLQIILLGQPELRQKLARPELAQLAQRIIARFHLGPLTKSDLAGYISHRMTTAGSQRPIIPRSLLPMLYRVSRGVPRVVNVVCDRALLGAYVEGKQQVDRKVLAKAVREVSGEEGVSREGFSASRWGLGAAGMACAGLVAAFTFSTAIPAMFVERPDPPAQAAAAPPGFYVSGPVKAEKSLLLDRESETSPLVFERVATTSLVAAIAEAAGRNANAAAGVNTRKAIGAKHDGRISRLPAKKDN